MPTANDVKPKNVDNHSEEEEEEEEEEEDDSPLPIKFRNYKPVDEKLKEYVSKQPYVPNIVEEINEKLSKVIEANKSCDILNLAPKKANWDLKRDLSKKLEILDKRTQRSIFEMVRQKFQQENSKDLSQKVDTMFQNLKEE